jgi:DNA-directed RNA polymerase specialized sigma24 family protein
MQRAGCNALESISWRGVGGRIRGYGGASVGGTENALRRELDATRLDSSRYPTEQRLIAAIRRGEEAAMRELFVLYAPLLRDEAKKMGVRSDERDQIVDTFLDDIVMGLVELEVLPRKLPTYLVRSLRNRLRTRHRDGSRRSAIDESTYGEYGDSIERVVAECHSEYGMRTAQSLDADTGTSMRSAIKKLADRSASELSQEELILMVGIGLHIPLRHLAEQLGVTYGAARVRLSRLRERFVRLAIQYVNNLEPAERREIERFFRRADVRLERGSSASPEGSGATAAKPVPPSRGKTTDV